ncbi:unnamed protein product, partial [Prorocentrum cordatum]
TTRATSCSPRGPSAPWTRGTGGGGAPRPWPPCCWSRPPSPRTTRRRRRGPGVPRWRQPLREPPAWSRRSGSAGDCDRGAAGEDVDQGADQAREEAPGGGGRDRRRHGPLRGGGPLQDPQGECPPAAGREAPQAPGRGGERRDWEGGVRRAPRGGDCRDRGRRRPVLHARGGFPQGGGGPGPGDRGHRVGEPGSLARGRGQAEKGARLCRGGSLRSHSDGGQRRGPQLHAPAQKATGQREVLREPRGLQVHRVLLRPRAAVLSKEQVVGDVPGRVHPWRARPCRRGPRGLELQGDRRALRGQADRAGGPVPRRPRQLHGLEVLTPASPASPRTTRLRGACRSAPPAPSTSTSTTATRGVATRSVPRRSPPSATGRRRTALGTRTTAARAGAAPPAASSATRWAASRPVAWRAARRAAARARSWATGPRRPRPSCPAGPSAGRSVGGSRTRAPRTRRRRLQRHLVLRWQGDAVLREGPRMRNSAHATCADKCHANSTWSCKKLGTRSWGLALVGYPSLFCVTFLRIDSYEPALVEYQWKERTGIFACDSFRIFADNVTTIAGRETLKTPKMEVEVIKDGTAGNAGIFMKAWEMIFAEGSIWDHDWTVKADPDAVFLPDRLRWRLEPHTDNRSREPRRPLRNELQRLARFGRVPLDVRLGGGLLSGGHAAVFEAQREV